MAERIDDPAVDSRSNYDYRGGDATAPEALGALTELIDGEVRLDTYTKQLYATDASIYEATPLAVTFPQSTDDVAATMRYCAEHDIPVLPRGAGTSLAGQSVNEAVVLDFTRHMNQLLEVTPSERRCVAQPGIVLAELNEAIADTGLTFAPDPAWADKSVLGGAIGNNSTGAHSLAYGKTDEYIESCEVVLADGSTTKFGWCDRSTIADRGDPDGDLEGRIYAYVDQLLAEHSDEIEAAFPDIHRNVSGYNLDRLVADAETGRINLARLLAGSEGTLAIVTAAEISLEPIPNETEVVLLLYDELLDAVADVEAVVDHDPAAVELVDDVLLDLARSTEEFGPIVATLPDAVDSVLLVEFSGRSATTVEQAVESLLADREADASARAMASRVAATPTEQERFWKLRKSGLPILLSRTGDEKHVAFIEDTAVPVDRLAEYVGDVQDILDDHDTFASFYAHAGPGCLHIRPLIHTKTAEGVESMERIADRITDLVVEYGGSISGEHGDGRARTQWARKQYGDAVFEQFVELKRTFDPQGLLNPGQVCGDVSMTEHLRFGPSYTFESPISPALHWENDNGFQGMVELCHGCGGCRGGQSTTGGTMCPTYRASNEEVTTTRGRANLLRQAMSGSLPDELLDDHEFMHEVLDLCIGCKGCARDCPSEVDMAKLKAEVTHAYHQRHGVDRRSSLFANIHRVSAIGSATAPLSNWATALPGAGWLGEHLLGIARERDLPPFQRETFLDWAHSRGMADPDDADVYLLPDTMTNYHQPAIGQSAVRVLEAADKQVAVPQSFHPVGREPFSMGRLDLAKDQAERMVGHLESRIGPDTTVLSLEPADAVMLQSDYRSLLDPQQAEPIAAASSGVAEYIVNAEIDLPDIGGDQLVTYHGHCHQKATGRSLPTATMLDRGGYTVDVLDSGCCGMAGSFGYEAEHYSMSKAIGSILYDQVDDSSGSVVTAPGGSCRHQLADHLGEVPPHPIQLLDPAIANQW